jgi:hypothetical protein
VRAVDFGAVKLSSHSIKPPMASAVKCKLTNHLALSADTIGGFLTIPAPALEFRISR